MPGKNLTRVEAEQRAALVTVHGSDIALDLTQGSEVFGSTTTIRFAAQDGAETFVDALTASVASVRLNGVDLDPASVSDGVRIRLTGLAAENELTVVATMRYTNSGEGLHRFVDPADGEAYLYTQLAVPDARRVFPVFEQPDLKGTWALTVTGPSRWRIVANQPTPEPVGLEPGVSRWVFPPTPALSSYLVALCVGPYVAHGSELVSSDGRVIPLGVLTRASLAQHMDPEDVFATTRAGFAFYESAFGIPFPFDKYDQIMVPEYNWGAMENAGAVTFNEVYVFRSRPIDAQREERAMVVLHELAHMWFGDLVTMRWWDDLWLNESFATFMSFLATGEATRWTDSWATFTTTEKNWAYEQDQLPSTHPIVAEIRDIEDVQVNFDGITYAKGASVLKQLVAHVGREPFLAGVGAYLRANGWGNATLADLLAELEAASGRDLASWSELWLRTAGVNTLLPELETDADGVITALAIVQTAPEAWPTLRPHRLAVGAYDRDATGALVRTARIELDVAGARTEVPELVGRPRPALLLVNDDDLAYAKLRLDPVSLATAEEALSRIDSALARTVVWSSIWDRTRDAEARGGDFVRLVVEHAGAETSSALLKTLLHQAVVAAEEFVHPRGRDAALDALASGVLRLLGDAAPGSDAQLQLAGALGRTARSADQLDLVAHLLDGTAPLAGLEVDPELRWVLLTGLVAAGRAGETEIAAELARDATATGRESSVLARAAIPTAAGKEAAWDSVIESDALPNAQVYATMRGWQRGVDPSVLEPFGPRYFDVIESLWATRTFSIAEELVSGLYPHAAASESLRSLTRRWLDEHPEPTPLRRIVVEHLSRLERTLAARAADA